MFYGALHGPPSGAPPGCIWTKQIEIPLSWIRAFLQGSGGEVERRFRLYQHLRLGTSVRITTDASPWGLGAVLEIDDKIVSFFADNVQDTDRTVLSLSDTGQSKDQQVLEALALLVALRE